MQIEYIKNPVWSNTKHTMIDLAIKWVEMDEELPFTASPDDYEEHGRTIFARCVAGEFGTVAAYTPPADITGEEALSMVRAERAHILATEVDPIVSNPLRWADLTAEQQTAWATYRRALLDITATFPNPSYVWTEAEKRHVLTNCTFPVKP